ncbi:MAG TPA: SRPBCC family protein [Streptosporangiaceae bacterium]|nr:SRPBCC family protein [Streptosporangiaceae bacterium]
MTGMLEDAGGRWRLRFTRALAHPPERVWRAITEPEQLRAWFPHLITGGWAVGTDLTFTDPQGRGPEFSGQVLAFEPPRLLEFRWGTDVIRLEIGPREGGRTLTLLDTLGELGKAARDAAGWHECLDRLACHLDGDAPTWRPGQRWAQVHPGYVASFGPRAAEIGPPPGYDPQALDAMQEPSGG